jgi:Arc/MetJ-type ribon-helix-helix transcriptional regulator
MNAWIETLESIEAGTDMTKEPTTQVAFRLPDSLIARLDRHVERVSKEHPGLDFSRTDAVRSLLTRALDQSEGSSDPTKRQTVSRDEGRPNAERQLNNEDNL